MKRLLLLFSVALLTTVSICRAADPLAPADPPVAQPPKAEDAPAPLAEADKKRIADLIQQLGDRDREKRKDAHNLLLQAGKPALPQLRDAAAQQRGTVATQARQIIRKIEAPPRDPAQLGGILQNILPNLQNGAPNVQVERQNNGVQQQQIIRIGGGQPQFAQNMPKPETTGADLMNSFGCKLIESGDGLRVTDVRVASHAERIGLKTGDLLTAINGREVTKETEAKEMLSDKNNLNNLRLEVTRKGESITLK
jgi:hypothetical protein